MAEVTLGQVTFQGYNGTIQPPKPVFEAFVALGDTQPYVQRLKTESKQSTVTFWTVVGTYTAVQTLIDALKKEVGIKNTIALNGQTFDMDVYLLDYSISSKCGAKSQWLVQVEATIITADRDY